MIKIKYWQVILRGYETLGLTGQLVRKWRMNMTHSERRQRKLQLPATVVTFVMGIVVFLAAIPFAQAQEKASEDQASADEQYIPVPPEYQFVMKDVYYSTNTEGMPTGGKIGKLVCNKRTVALKSHAFENGFIITEKFGKIKVQVSHNVLGGGFSLYMTKSQLDKLEKFLHRREPQKDEASELDGQSLSRVASETLIDTIDFSAWAPKSLNISPDGTRVAYAAREGDKMFVVVDGEEGKRHDGIAVGTPFFSPDGARVAYEAIEGDKWLVVVDGEEGKRYDGIGKGDPVFSPDGAPVAYQAREGDKWLVVVDGEEGKRYDGIAELIFSPDGARAAYAAQEGDKWFVVVDGKEGKRYDGIVEGTLVFSPDSARVAYGAIEGDKQFVVVDGEEGKRYDSIAELIFSPDGTRVTHAAQEGDKMFIVVDGEEGKRYDGIWQPIFSPDSARVAYRVKEGDKMFIVVDGEEGKRYDGIAAPIFSPDSARVAYVAGDGGKRFVVVDGEEGKRYDAIGSPIFSPDSAHVAYGAQEDDKWFVVVDGEEGRKRYEGIASLTFSPESKRVAYVAQISVTQAVSKMFVVVDGEEGKQYDDIAIRKGGRIVFSSPHSFHYIAAKEGETHLVEEKISPTQKPEDTESVPAEAEESSLIPTLDIEPGRYEGTADGVATFSVTVVTENGYPKVKEVGYNFAGSLDIGRAFLRSGKAFGTIENDKLIFQFPVFVRFSASQNLLTEAGGSTAMAPYRAEIGIDKTGQLNCVLTEIPTLDDDYEGFTFRNIGLASPPEEMREQYTITLESKEKLK